MATFTDTLLTVFKVAGAAQLVNSFNNVATASSAASKFLNDHNSTTKQLDKAFDGLKKAQNAFTGSVQGFLATNLVATMKQALEVFAEDEQAIFRTSVVLKNLGNSFPIERAQAFASDLQALTGVDDEAIVSLVGLEKRFGIADSQIEKTTKTILDFSKATGIGLEEAGQAVGRALLGQTRGLRALGIEFTATGNKANDLIAIQTKLNDLFGGAAEANRNTLQGSLDALRETGNNVLSAFGEKMSTVVVPALNLLNEVLIFLTKNMYLLIGALDFLHSRPNAAAEIGTGKGKLATEDTLKEVADNTKGTNEALIKAVLGGSLSTFARGGANARDFQLAFRA